MIDIIWGGSDNPELNLNLALWCGEQIWPGTGETFGRCTTMGVLLNGELIGVVVFHNWQREAGVIEFSGAATNKRWLTRRVLHAMFDYIFEIPGLQMAITRTSEKLTHLRMLQAYGFRQYAIPRLYGREEAGIIHTLTVEDWRHNKFERKRNGLEKRCSTAA